MTEQTVPHLKGTIYLNQICCSEPHLLATRVLELGTTQSLNDGSLVLLTSTHRHDGLSNVHTGHSALGFAERTSHASLEPATRA